MAVVCPSRFAVLKVEGEDTEEQQKSNKKNKAKAAPKAAAAAAVKTAENKAPKAKKKKKQPVDKESVAKSATRSQEGSGDWESWKKRDDQFVTDTFEQDLQEALLLSRVEYEKKRGSNSERQKEATPAKVAVPKAAPPKAALISENKTNKKKKKNKEKKNATMSLDEFNQLGDAEAEEAADFASEDPSEFPSSSERRQTPLCREDIFDQVLKDAEDIINKEQRIEDFKKKQPFCLEQVRQIQFQEELDKKDLEIARLSSEVERLTAELKVVKVRNKQLCIILGHGEMKDKAEILKNYEELNQVKDELTQEVAELHAALEQERSKVHSLQTELKKPGKKENR